MMQQWFRDAKLGIFIHYGIYAVKGVSESWSFYNGNISYEDYMDQLNGFTAKNYDADEWAQLFDDAGAKYAVLTSKHHDGVALFDTKLSDLNVVKKTPAKRDLIGPYCDALRKKGLKVGIYYSHPDWSYPDYPSVYANHEIPEDPSTAKKFSYPTNGVEDLEAWGRFLNFHRGQLRELMTNYGTVDLLWFDGDWERSAEQWDMKGLRDYLHSFNPNVILNSRMNGYGDYETPEQGVPIVGPQGPWEFCVTVNDNWGYVHTDKHYKSARQLVRMFAETIGLGGNMLLDVGAMEDGTIDPEQATRLRELGSWIKKHDEAIYGTVAGLPSGLFNGTSTLSKDRKTLYLFMFGKPFESTSLKGIKNKIKSISLVADGTPVDYEIFGKLWWSEIPGVVWIKVPDDKFDTYATVLKVELEGELELYMDKGHAIENNM